MIEAVRAVAGSLTLNIVPAGPAVLCGLVLFLVPGALWLALLRREDRAALARDEAAVPRRGPRAWRPRPGSGLVLAEAGVFSLVTAAALVVVGACAVVARPRAAGARALRGAASAAAPHALGDRAAVAVLCLRPLRAARRVPAGRPRPRHLRGGHGDASRARAASPYVDPAVLSIPAEDVELFYRHPERPDYSWGRFMGFPLERPQTGPRGPASSSTSSPPSAPTCSRPWACGARWPRRRCSGCWARWPCFFALRRIFGPAPALLGALLLARERRAGLVRALPGVGADVAVPDPVRRCCAFALWEERRLARLRRAGRGRCSASRCWCASTASCSRSRSWPGSLLRRARGDAALARRGVSAADARSRSSPSTPLCTPRSGRASTCWRSRTARTGASPPRRLAAGHARS